MNPKRFFATATLAIATGIAVFAQGEAKNDDYKNELGIDVANIITFLAKKSESYLLNYKRHLSAKHTLRSGLNVDYSSAEDGYKEGGLRFGYERRYPIVSAYWKLHWGVDASFAYHASNFQPNATIRYGLHPLIGFGFYPVPRFSLSSEVALNLYYTDKRNPRSFAKADNANVFSVGVGSVGMVVLAYHF